MRADVAAFFTRFPALQRLRDDHRAFLGRHKRVHGPEVLPGHFAVRLRQSRRRNVPQGKSMPSSTGGRPTVLVDGHQERANFKRRTSLFVSATRQGSERPRRSLHADDAGRVSEERQGDDERNTFDRAKCNALMLRRCRAR